MKELREIVDTFLWIAALVAGMTLIVLGVDRSYQSTGPAMMIGGSVLASTAMACFYFGFGRGK